MFYLWLECLDCHNLFFFFLTEKKNSFPLSCPFMHKYISAKLNQPAWSQRRVRSC